MNGVYIMLLMWQKYDTNLHSKREVEHIHPTWEIVKTTFAFTSTACVTFTRASALIIHCVALQILAKVKFANEYFIQN